MRIEGSCLFIIRQLDSFFFSFSFGDGLRCLLQLGSTFFANECLGAGSQVLLQGLEPF